MKKILKISLSIFLIGGLVLLLVFSEKEFYQRPCKRMVVQVEVPGADTLIYPEELDRLILNKFDTLIGKSLNSINLEELKHLLTENYFIHKSDVSITVNGTLRIYAVQRKPVLRIFSADYSSWYIDDAGMLFPVKGSSPAYVPVLSTEQGLPGKDIIIPGQSISTLGIPVLDIALSLGIYLSKDQFLSSLIDQIIISKEGEFELIPKVAGSVIELGKGEDLDEKFENLFWIYKKVLPVKGWEYYEKIDLKYENHVVCSK